MMAAGKRYRIQSAVPGRGRDRSAAIRPRAPEDEAAGLGRAAPDLDRMIVGVRAMRDAIESAKREIATIRASAEGHDRIQRAATELDAVVVATEEATTTILAAVEDIETAANALRDAPPDGARAAPIAAILDRVLVLYEACNFQDITGQRISKVVGTLQFLEDRLDRMLEAYGPVAPSPEPPAGAADRPEGGGLVGGPGLPGETGHVSQVDVDAYFAES
jgi:chemotaxis protein CheZ